jgi:hypothetical protein
LCRTGRSIAAELACPQIVQFAGNSEIGPLPKALTSFHISAIIEI